MNYNDYLLTDYWKMVSQAVKARAGYRCQICNSGLDLQAHHRTYEHRGNEINHLDDLTCLCRRCHAVFHGKQEAPAPTPTPNPVKPVKANLMMITKDNFRRVRNNKEMWWWMKENGIEPDKKGWAKRMIGQIVPKHFLRGDR
jgi:hypothetical protein